VGLATAMRDIDNNVVDNKTAEFSSKHCWRETFLHFFFNFTCHQQ
jgi:hypothetical protein